MEHKKRFTLEKLIRRLKLLEPLTIRQRQPIAPFRYAEHPDALTDSLTETDIDDSQWPVIQPHSYWGKWNTNFTLRSRFTVPSDWPKQQIPALEIKIGEVSNWDFCHPESLVYIDGRPFAGADKYHKIITLSDVYCDGKEHRLALHGYSGRWGHFDTEPKFQLFMEDCSVILMDRALSCFVAAVRVVLQTVQVLDPDSPERAKLLGAADQAFQILDTREPFEPHLYESVSEAHRFLEEGVKKAGYPLDVDVTAVGHSHIDVAWLWPLAQTRRKCGRTFSTTLRLMKEFKSFVFTQSQAQLYDFVRQDYPSLFKGIQEKAAAGQWEVTGGMWVEADCNLSGAESLVRQFLLGRTFFAKHFGQGTEAPILWLPDVFGYCVNLPQLIQQAGLKYFYTTKMAWNQYNRIPYDTFLWRGLDGTEILTHLGTTTPSRTNKMVTYNGAATPEEIQTTWTHYQQKELSTELMTAFGHGDGGGGVTREMLENISEMRQMPGLPRVSCGRAIDFFEKLEKSCEDNLPRWQGELYLEYHRGTYTTQARIKKANRTCEFAMHNAEWLAGFAAVLESDYEYPHPQLNQAWQLLCLNQFHDIIPGSSITEVYEQALSQYQEVMQTAKQIQNQALKTLWQYTRGQVLVANPNSFRHASLARLPEPLAEKMCLVTAEGAALATQVVENGTLIDVGQLDPYSINPLCLVEEKKVEISTGLKVAERTLENDYLRVLLNDEGELVSIYDKKADREIITSSAVANQFQVFEDRPLDWDAWDIDIFYDDKMWVRQTPRSIRIVEQGPLRAAIEIKGDILNSTYTQRILLSHHSARIDFETEIDWREKHILLKAAFPLQIHTDQARYEVQWGNVQRPTHCNTSWDWARFETCAHKWVDVSEGDYGVSLLNNCKYGHDVRDGVVRLSLLRSPTMPDPNADQGLHTFTYSLLPHSGNFSMETIAQAYMLNNPPIVYKSSSPVADLQKLPSVIQADRDHVIIETIKQAENHHGLIVRLYEARCRRGLITLTTAFQIQSCCRTNLLEEDEQALACKGNRIELHIKPYEIVTLRIISTRE